MDGTSSRLQCVALVIAATSACGTVGVSKEASLRKIEVEAQDSSSPNAPTAAVPALQQIIVTALARDPELTALAAEARAAVHRARAAGALPDATLAGQVWGAPVVLPWELGRSDALMFGPRQMIPALGLDLDARAVVEVAEAKALLIQWRMRRLMLAREMTHIVIMLATASDLVRLQDEQRATLEQVLATQNQLLAAGLGGAEDVVDVNVELTRLRVTRARHEIERRKASTALRTALGEAIPSVSPWIAPVEVPAEATLISEAHRQRPEMAMADLDIERARAGVDIADAERMFPDLMVGLDYMWMPGEEGIDEHRYGAMASISLPWFAERHDQEASAARADVDGAVARREAAARTIEGEVRDARERFVSAVEIVAALEGPLEQSARRAVEANLASFAAGRGSMLGVLRAQERLLAVRQEAVEARSQRQLAAADLAWAQGSAVVPLFPLDVGVSQ